MTEQPRFSGTMTAIHVMAWICLVLAALPITLGALVSSFKVGMAVPDGATTFGQTLWLYPWWKATFGIKLEHTHRLAGMALGLVIIVLDHMIFFTERRAYIRWLGQLSLAVVLVQGELGRMRVDENALWGRELATVHAGWAQIVLAVLVALVVVTSPWWLRTPQSLSPKTQAIRRWSLLLAGVTYLQMIVGAFYRHQSTGFYIHATVGYTLFALTMLSALVILMDDAAKRRLGWALVLPLAGVFAQIILGNSSALVYGNTPREFVSEITNLQAFTTAAHLVVGSAFFAGTIVLAMASHRVLTSKGVSE